MTVDQLSVTHSNTDYNVFQVESGLRNFDGSVGDFERGLKKKKKSRCLVQNKNISLTSRETQSSDKGAVACFAIVCFVG